MIANKWKKQSKIREKENVAGGKKLCVVIIVAIEEPGGKRSLVKNIIAQQTSLNKAMMEPYL